jgi:hypothetical protein
MSNPPSPTTVGLAKGTALLLSSLSSGIVLSLSTFLVPRLLESPTPTMLTQWQRTYTLGASTMPFTGLISAAAYFWLGLRAGISGVGGFRGRMYVVAGALTVGIVPFTVLVMRGTNEKLKVLRERFGLDAKGEQGEVVAEEERSAKGLVDWWGVLNLGRAGLLIAGTVCGLVATL